MKKFISSVLSVAMATTMFCGINVSAAKDEIKVLFDGTAIEFDVNPEIIEGRTMVPLRKIFEEIGAFVKWNSDTQTVSARKNSKTITLTVGTNELNIDKGKTDDEGNPIIETVSLEVPAQIVDGRTLVPARAISESFGLNVDWNENNKEVVITSDDENDDSWKENEGSINLSDLTFEGNGIEITDNQIKITAGGDYTLKGTLTDGNITVSTKEKVKFRLSGASITSSKDPCIFVEKADKFYITLTDGTENYLVATNSEDGAIYSKENFEIKGDGALTVTSDAGHAIKASDNLTIENGNITLNAQTDGIHINDTFKMTGGNINITAVGDGIDCESIVKISDGKINIETNGVPLETATTQETTTNNAPRRGMWEETASVEFEKSSKGINAEWMMCISDGEFTINSASHAIHCDDEIEINGGKFILSSKYEKGISAHGNLTISNSETFIDVTKSTEGLESKNVMTINDGLIKIVSTDDAINATGGSTGFMMGPGGNTGDGENRFPTEGFERNPDRTQQMQNPQGGQRPQRPTRGENGQWQRPEIPENGTVIPSSVPQQNGEFTPNFTFPDGEGFQFPEFTMPETNKGMQMPGGFMGGFMGRNAKDCLIINGGTIEAVGSDDCIDANGNMKINGGTIKATNPTGSFSGNFGVLDADGQITISENASIMLASSNGNEKSLNLSQNYIIVYCNASHVANDKITVSDIDGNVVYEYAPSGSYKTVLIASNSLETGKKYTITVGEETFEAEILAQSTVVGTQPTGGQGGRWQFTW